MGMNKKKFSRWKKSLYIWRSKNPRVQFLVPPTLHKDPASITKAKTLTILNRCAENPFEWTGGCTLTPTSGISWETIPSENKWVIWLDTYVQGWNGCATSKSPKPLPNEIQSVASSSTWRQMVVQRTKKFTTKELEKSASDKRTAKKAQKEH